MAPPIARDRATDGQRLGLVGGALVAVLAVVGGLLLLAGGDGDDPVKRASGTATATQTVEEPDGTSGSPPDQQSGTEDAPPTEKELEEFARSYVRIASSDPDRGITMLTADYRAASLDYRGFWGSMSNPRILRIEADPEDLRVSYTYSYRLDGIGRRTEDVVLQLVRQGDRLLISGAS